MPGERAVQGRSIKAASSRFLYGMLLEWKELPCKSAESAHRSTPSSEGRGTLDRRLRPGHHGR